MVDADEPSRDGRRPERVTYTITPAGRDALVSWVTQSLGDPDLADEFPAALSFMYSLGRDQAAQVLEGRAAALGQGIDADRAALAKAEIEDGIAPIFLSEHHYQVAIRQAEVDWLSTFVPALRSGALGWPTLPEGS